MIRVERNRLAIARHGARRIALKPVGIAKIVVVIGGARIAGDRRTDQAFGLNVIAVLLSDDAEKMQRFWVIWFNAQDFAVARLCLGEVVGLMVCQAARENLADFTDISSRRFGGECEHRVVTRGEEEQAPRQTRNGAHF